MIQIPDMIRDYNSESVKKSIPASCTKRNSILICADREYFIVFNLENLKKIFLKTTIMYTSSFYSNEDGAEKLFLSVFPKKTVAFISQSAHSLLTAAIEINNQFVKETS